MTLTKLGPYEVHPFADAFPLMDGEEFGELVHDIKKNGLREPILLSHDKTTLVDGRNRYRACEAAGVDVVHETLPARYTETMLLDLIVSKNLARRQLNRGQAAFLGMRYLELYEAAAKQTQGSKGKAKPHGESTSVPADLPESGRERESRQRAARATGSSGRSVQSAKYVEKHAPDLATTVKAGRLSLDAAYKQAKRRVKSTPKPDPKPKPSPVMLALRTHTGEEVAYPKPQSKATFTEQDGDGISWARWSWNPVTGCLHGCDYCYARAIAHRYKDRFPVGFTPLFHEERLGAPVNTVIPPHHRNETEPCEPYGCPYRRVFVCSMADLYGRWVPDEWIERVHASMLAAPDWQYILLTKFPARYVGLDIPPNAWVGTSVDEQKRVRIAQDAMAKLDGGMVKWLSLEPLKEPLEFDDLSMFDWVVIGAQTETHQPDGVVPALAPHYDWVQQITEKARAAGCRVHHKPNLTNGRPGMQMLNQYPDAAQ
jgi:protein gp37